MIAVWSSPMPGISTTLQRSSEVRGRRYAWHHHHAHCWVFTLLNALCCVSLATATISLPAGLQSGLPFTMLMECACVFKAVHVAGTQAAGDKPALLWIHWKTTHFKGCFSNIRPWDCLFGRTSLFLAAIQEVELMTLGSQAWGLCLWGEAWPDIVQKAWVHWGFVESVSYVLLCFLCVHFWVNVWLRNLNTWYFLFVFLFVKFVTFFFLATHLSKSVGLPHRHACTWHLGCYLLSWEIAPYLEQRKLWVRIAHHFSGSLVSQDRLFPPPPHTADW